MTYKPTQNELDEAMSDMECWQTQEHLKKCSKCRNSYLESVIPKERKDEMPYSLIKKLNGGEEALKYLIYGFNDCIDLIRHNAGLNNERK